MQDSDLKIFRAVMAETAEAVTITDRKNFDLDRKAMVYFRALKDEPYSLEQVMLAFRSWSKKNKYFPALADIIEQLDLIAHGGLTHEQRIAQAWDLVIQALNRYGGCSVRFPIPAFHYAILHDPQGGTWERYDNSVTNENMPFRAKDFAVYFEIGEKKATFGYEPNMIHVPDHLAGSDEIHNRIHGYLDICPPRVFNVLTGEQKVLALTESDKQGKAMTLAALTAQKLKA